MKSMEQINKALDKIENPDETQFSGMTYEQGVVEALMWVMDDISDEEFEFADK